ncbi:MAG: hypothetical protein PVJ73_04605 [Acidobacteriota bacterium]|jgi:hypothetical protein
MLNRCASVVVALTLGLVAGASAQDTEHYQALAVNMSNVELGAPTPVDIVIERWSTDAEKARIVEAFQKGQEELLSTIQKIRPRVGYIARPGHTGWDLGYANRVRGEDGGWQIVVLTDRRMGFRELAEQPRSVDYPFTLIEMHVDDDGFGEGRASVATKITWDAENRTLELENYTSDPVRLQNVKRVD